MLTWCRHRNHNHNMFDVDEERDHLIRVFSMHNWAMTAKEIVSAGVGEMMYRNQYKIDEEAAELRLPFIATERGWMIKTKRCEHCCTQQLIENRYAICDLCAEDLNDIPGSEK